jgi:hypothetical protein
MSDKHLQREKRQVNRCRLRRQAMVCGLHVEPLENRLMLHADGSSHLAAAVPLGHELAAGIAPVVQIHALPNGHVVSNPVHAHLVITKSPGTARLLGFVFAGVPFSVAAAVVDNHGRVLTGYDGRMTVSLAANPGRATLGGTVTATAKDGVVVFSGLTLSRPGNGYVLIVSGGGLVAKTARFDVQVNEVYHIE